MKRTNTLHQNTVKQICDTASANILTSGTFSTAPTTDVLTKFDEVVAFGDSFTQLALNPNNVTWANELIKMSGHTPKVYENNFATDFKRTDHLATQFKEFIKVKGEVNPKALYGLGIGNNEGMYLEIAFLGDMFQAFETYTPTESQLMDVLDGKIATPNLTKYCKVVEENIGEFIKNFAASQETVVILNHYNDKYRISEIMKYVHGINDEEFRISFAHNRTKEVRLAGEIQSKWFNDAMFRGIDNLAPTANVVYADYAELIKLYSNDIVHPIFNGHHPTDEMHVVTAKYVAQLLNETRQPIAISNFENKLIEERKIELDKIRNDLLYNESKTNRKEAALFLKKHLNTPEHQKHYKDTHIPKSSGFCPGYIADHVELKDVSAMIKPVSNFTDMTNITNARRSLDLPNEYVAGTIAKLLIHNRTPHINIAKGLEQGKTLLISRFLGEETLAKFLGADSSDVYTTCHSVISDNDKLKNLHGFEKIITISQLLGDMDFQPYNIMVGKEEIVIKDRKTGEETLNEENVLYRIDYGKSFVYHFPKDFGSLVKELMCGLSFGYHFSKDFNTMVNNPSCFYRAITKGNLNFNIKKYSEALDQILSNVGDGEHINNLIDHSINELKKTGFDTKDRVVFVTNKIIHNFDELSKHYKDTFRYNLENMKKISEDVRIVSKFDIDDSFKNGGWIQTFVESNINNPIEYAIKNNIKIENTDAKEFATKAAKAKEQRLAAEQEATRLETEQAEIQRLAAEQEAARLQAEQAEIQRLAAEQEATRLETEQAEIQRLAAEQEATRLETEQAEIQRLAAEQEATRLQAEQDTPTLAAQRMFDEENKSLLATKLELETLAAQKLNALNVAFKTLAADKAANKFAKFKEAQAKLHAADKKIEASVIAENNYVIADTPPPLDPAAAKKIILTTKKLKDNANKAKLKANSEQTKLDNAKKLADNAMKNASLATARLAEAEAELTKATLTLDINKHQYTEAKILADNAAKIQRDVEIKKTKMNDTIKKVHAKVVFSTKELSDAQKKLQSTAQAKSAAQTKQSNLTNDVSNSEEATAIKRAQLETSRQAEDAKKQAQSDASARQATAKAVAINAQAPSKNADKALTVFKQALKTVKAVQKKITDLKAKLDAANTKAEDDAVQAFYLSISKDALNASNPTPTSLNEANKARLDAAKKAQLAMIARNAKEDADIKKIQVDTAVDQAQLAVTSAQAHFNAVKQVETAAKNAKLDADRQKATSDAELKIAHLVTVKDKKEFNKAMRTEKSTKDAKAAADVKLSKLAADMVKAEAVVTSKQAALEAATQSEEAALQDPEHLNSISTKASASSIHAKLTLDTLKASLNTAIKDKTTATNAFSKAAASKVKADKDYANAEKSVGIMETNFYAAAKKVEDAADKYYEESQKLHVPVPSEQDTVTTSANAHLSKSELSKVLSNEILKNHKFLSTELNQITKFYKDIVFFGDSFTYTAAGANTYAERILKAIKSKNGHNFAKDFKTTSDLDNQLENYMQSMHGKLNPKTLFCVYMGPNDIMNLKLELLRDEYNFKGDSHFTTEELLAIEKGDIPIPDTIKVCQDITQNMSDFITKLDSKGAKNILVLSHFNDAHRGPQPNKNAKLFGEIKSTLLNKAITDGIENAHPKRLNVLYANYHDLIEQINSNPEQYIPETAPFIETPFGPSKIFDGTHPTDIVHELTAKYLVELVTEVETLGSNGIIESGV